MKKLIIWVFSVIIVIVLTGCAGSKSVNRENPKSLTSAKISLQDGTTREGIILKRDGSKLIYVDSGSHSKETLGYEKISKIEKSDQIYDFEAYAIPLSTVKEYERSNRIFSYAAGGFILGTALGTGVGISLIASDVDIKMPVPMAVFGITGAYYFGKLGSKRAFEDAVYEAQKFRYEISKEKRARLINDEKNKLKEQQKQKEELLKRLEEKGKE
ncbi:MAG: hypothetical protein AB7W47_01775 [Calditrichaceae bacterium]